MLDFGSGGAGSIPAVDTLNFDRNLGLT
jgi:hypothetical protein